MKPWLTISLLLGACLMGRAQQIVCEQVMLSQINQPDFYASGLLQVQRDSLRLLGDVHVRNLNAVPSRAWLRPLQNSGCDTLPGHSFAVSKQYYVLNSLGRTNQRGRVLVSTALNGQRANDSVMVLLHLFGRDGRVRWTKRLPPQLQHGKAEVATGLLEAPDGGFYVSGLSFLVKIDSLGNLLWRRNYRCGSLYSPTYTQRGTLLFALQRYTDLMVMEFNQQGDSLTSKQLSPSPQEISSTVDLPLAAQVLQPLHDGGFVVVGQVDSASTGFRRPFLVRLDQNLNIQWTYFYRSQPTPVSVNNFPYNLFSFPYELTDGSLVVLQQNYSSGRNWPYWLFRFSATGNLQNTYAFVSQTLPPPTGSYPHYLGYLGKVQGLQPRSDSTFVLASTGSGINGQYIFSNYLARLKVPGLRRVIDSYQVPGIGPLATRAATTAWPAPAYPNPATTSVTVLLPALPGAAQLTLTDLLGRRVRAQAVAAGTGAAVLEVGGLAPGVYLLSLEQAGQAPAVQRLTVAGP